MIRQLELRLQKRLLIVEAVSKEIAEAWIFNNYGMKAMIYSRFICKASEFNEDIAKEFVDQRNIEEYEIFYDYKNERWFDYSMTALESFISAIEAKGYYWGENPSKDPYTQIEIYGNDSPETTMNYHYDLEKFENTQSRTFNLENTLIFEILE